MIVRLYFALVHEFCEMLERAIISTFGVIGEKTGGQFPASYMILKTIAADAFARAGLVTAIAALEIIFLFAVHKSHPLISSFLELYTKMDDR